MTGIRMHMDPMMNETLQDDVVWLMKTYSVPEKQALDLAIQRETARSIHRLTNMFHDFDHQLSLGIRYGLFGTGACDSSTVLSLKQED